MIDISPKIYANIYTKFDSPITSINCGDKCAPFNKGNIPFCCDIQHAIPSAYQTEWIYLQENSDLWHEWVASNSDENRRMNDEKPVDQVLLQCKGHLECQRNFRTLTCRAFPFFPYIDRYGAFLGLSYYWMYINQCWVISNLDRVTREYLNEFVVTFDNLFKSNPYEKENFRYHSIITRRVFGRQHRDITILHRNGFFYSVKTSTGELSPLKPETLEKFYPYSYTDELLFPDEVL